MEDNKLKPENGAEETKIHVNEYGATKDSAVVVEEARQRRGMGDVSELVGKQRPIGARVGRAVEMDDRTAGGGTLARSCQRPPGDVVGAHRHRRVPDDRRGERANRLGKRPGSDGR